MDVRMLGSGRPFALEVINARTSVHTPEFFRSVEEQLDKVIGPAVRHPDMPQSMQRSQLARLACNQSRKLREDMLSVLCVQADCGVKAHSLQVLDKQQLAAMKVRSAALAHTGTCADVLALACCFHPVRVEHCMSPGPVHRQAVLAGGGEPEAKVVYCAVLAASGGHRRGDRHAHKRRGVGAHADDARTRCAQVLPCQSELCGCPMHGMQLVAAVAYQLRQSSAACSASSRGWSLQSRSSLAWCSPATAL